MLLPETFAELVVRLANGGKADEALSLARKLLMPFVQSQDSYNSWLFERLLDQVGPPLVDSAGLAALELFCEMLTAALGDAEASAATDEATRDDSYVWRPAIEEHAQNGPTGFRAARNALVSVVRDLAAQAITERHLPVRDVVDLIERHSRVIFRRLALHMLRTFPDAAPDLVAARLTTHELFDLPCFRHEYYWLSAVGFKRLSEDDQSVILGWIGSDQAWVRSGSDNEPEAHSEGGEGDAEDDGTDYRRLCRLSAFHTDLPTDWKARYDALLGHYGVPEHPDFVMFWSHGFVDATSPISAEQLRTLSVEQIVEYLSNWQPSGNWQSASREGLGQLLTQAVASDPARFDQDAERFVAQHPTYIAAIFGGFIQALKEQRPFPWEGVLRLAQRCVHQPQSPQDHASTSEQSNALPQENVGLTADAKRVDLASLTRSTGTGEPDAEGAWTWTCIQIAILLLHALEARPSPLPLSLWEVVWDVLRALAEDPNPTGEDDLRYGGINMNPVERSINTVRGLALHAVVCYGLWVQAGRQNTQEMPIGANQTAARNVDGTQEGQGLAALPEVRAVLDAHLDPSLEPSHAVLAVYGQRFPSLLAFDSAWTSEHVAAIFPPGDEERARWDAAWHAYIVFNPPYRSVFDVLRSEYERAVARMGTHSKDLHMLADPDVRLVEHLLELAWAGVLTIDESGGLMVDVQDRTPDAVFGHAIANVGHRLLNSGEEIPPEIVAHLQTLWQWRMDHASRTGPRAHRGELAAFGWWFGSGRLPVPWALDQLLETLRLGEGHTDANHLVLERLAGLAATWPLATITCLRLLVEGDERDHISIWRDQVAAVMQTVRDQTDDPTAKEELVRLINVLAVRGHLDFRQYLPPRPGERQNDGDGGTSGG